jgi:hypothetical protein
MILPRVLSSHEEATVRCAEAHPGSNSSAGSKAPVRLKTSGPHVLASLVKLDPVFIGRCDAEATCRTHPIWLIRDYANAGRTNYNFGESRRLEETDVALPHQGNAVTWP